MNQKTKDALRNPKFYFVVVPYVICVCLFYVPSCFLEWCFKQIKKAFRVAEYQTKRYNRFVSAKIVPVIRRIFAWAKNESAVK